MHERRFIAVTVAASAAVFVAVVVLVTGACSAGEKVRVYYPAGECATGVIEVEIFDRTRQQWGPHPEHPQVHAGTCQDEDPGVLLQEIRIRCIDPRGAQRPSAWRVGFDVFRPRAAPDCD